MQIPILNGVYTNEAADFRTSYPRNLVPVPKQNGISQGYLRPADGIVKMGDGPGPDRGGINWNGECYRVMGSKFVHIDRSGNHFVIQDIGGTSPVSMDYSFDRLAICSEGQLWYFDGFTTNRVSDPDLGVVYDVLWIDGYFMTTDGTSIIVTELTDPWSVNPLKYGSAEADPDKIQRLIKVRNEPYAVGRYSIEAFSNVGGNFFPFQRIPGSFISRGSVGNRSACMFMDVIAFVGGGRNEPIAVWTALNGDAAKISTREVDQILKGYDEDWLSKNCVVESRIDDSHQFIYIHLKDQTLIYDAAASKELQEHVWHSVDSGLVDKERYKARGLVRVHGKWIVGDPTTGAYGYFDDSASDHYGETVGWEFGTTILYNEGRGAIVHDLELVTLTGRVKAGKDPVVWTSYSIDGETWSQEHPKSAGKIGQRNVRLCWLQQGWMRSWRIQKFRGNSDAFLSFSRLEAKVEPLNV